MIEYAWAIKDQIIWPKLKKKLLKRFFAETTREILSGQFERAREAHFASSGSQSEQDSLLPCPLRDSAIQTVKLGLRFLSFEKKQ